MLRIAIVDDDAYSIRFCLACIHEMGRSDIDIVDTFDSGTAFLDEVCVKKTQYDIIILDIDMPDMNGFEVAKKVNEQNDGTIIMFYTVHEQYVYKAYEYQPFRYIRKNFTKEELPFHLNCAVEKVKQQEDSYIRIKSLGTSYRINVKNIEYIKKYRNELEIHMISGITYPVRNTLANLMENIDSDAFVLVNRSDLVNMKYVEKIMTNELLTETGSIIPISRRNQKQVEQTFLTYIGKSV